MSQGGEAGASPENCVPKLDGLLPKSAWADFFHGQNHFKVGKKQLNAGND